MNETTFSCKVSSKSLKITDDDVVGVYLEACASLVFELFDFVNDSIKATLRVERVEQDYRCWSM